MTSDPLRVLLLEWLYPDNADLEREVFAAENIEFDIRRWRANTTDHLDTETCACYDAVIHYHGAERLREKEEWFSNCRLLVRAGVGTDNIDLAAWGKMGVPVANVPDYGTHEVAEHAIALMFGLVRGIAEFGSALRADPVAGWRYDAPPLIRRLSGSTFGVVGMGPIGIAAARRAAGLGMKVVFYDPYVAAGTELGLGVERVHALQDLLALADVVSIHVPGTDSTRNMFDASAFSASRPGQIIVNTARGQVLNLDDLAAAIRQGRIGGAALDVLVPEPPNPDHPLIRAWRDAEPWIAGRLIITPHAAFHSPSSARDLRLKSVEQVINYLRHGRLSSCVNRGNLQARV